MSLLLKLALSLNVKQIVINKITKRNSNAKFFLMIIKMLNVRQNLSMRTYSMYFEAKNESQSLNSWNFATKVNLTKNYKKKKFTLSLGNVGI